MVPFDSTASPASVSASAAVSATVVWPAVSAAGVGAAEAVCAFPHPVRRLPATEVTATKLTSFLIKFFFIIFFLRVTLLQISHALFDLLCEDYHTDIHICKISISYDSL